MHNQSQDSNTKLTPHQINCQIDEVLTTARDQLERLLKLNGKSHEMDAYPSQFVSVIEDQIIPDIESILDFDPTPDTPYDFFH